jgi:hypothetical protein
MDIRIVLLTFSLYNEFCHHLIIIFNDKLILSESCITGCGTSEHNIYSKSYFIISNILHLNQNLKCYYVLV